MHLRLQLSTSGLWSASNSVSIVRKTKGFAICLVAEQKRMYNSNKEAIFTGIVTTAMLQRHPTPASESLKLGRMARLRVPRREGGARGSIGAGHPPHLMAYLIVTLLCATGARGAAEPEGLQEAIEAQSKYKPYNDTVVSSIVQQADIAELHRRVHRAHAGLAQLGSPPESPRCER